MAEQRKKNDSPGDSASAISKKKNTQKQKMGKGVARLAARMVAACIGAISENYSFHSHDEGKGGLSRLGEFASEIRLA